MEHSLSHARFVKAASQKPRTYESYVENHFSKLSPSSVRSGLQLGETIDLPSRRRNAPRAP